MARNLRPLILVIAPGAVGAILRSLEISTANREITASAGMVAPSEVAHALARADEFLALGLIVSLAAALVWLGSALKRRRPEQLACTLVLLGLIDSSKIQHRGCLGELLVALYWVDRRRACHACRWRGI